MTLQPVPALRRHIYDLATAFRCSVLEMDVAPEKAMAVVDTGGRGIVIGRIHDETTYAVALHELGHLCDGNGSIGGRGNRALTLHEEESAWAWARHYALDWTEAMEAVAQYALGTYALPPPPAPQKRIDWSKF